MRLLIHEQKALAADPENPKACGRTDCAWNEFRGFPCKGECTEETLHAAYKCAGWCPPGAICVQDEREEWTE